METSLLDTTVPPPEGQPNLSAAREIPVPALSLERFTPVVGERRASVIRDAARRARRLLADRAVWHVSSTATAGGVAETVRTLVGYARAAGIDARWLVAGSDPSFFAIARRLHDGLHDSTGDGGPLGPDEQRHYGAVLGRTAAPLLARVRAGDLVVLHDPPTAGLVDGVRAAGARVVWHGHGGSDTMTAIVERAWEFLRPHLRGADAYVLSRAVSGPAWLDGRSPRVIPPSIDVAAAQNQPLGPATVRAILGRIGLLARGTKNGAPVYARNDGTPAVVERRATIVRSGAPLLPPSPLVAQISRWDRRKDMLGVLLGFARTVEPGSEVTLALVGPDVRGVGDDPEASDVFGECVDAWQALPRPLRDQVILVLLPTEDADENAVMVNAIQRHATVVVQKSLQEGVGLAVAEAMWKGRAIVTTAVGGIRDQVRHDVHAIVLDDPADLHAFGQGVNRLLDDRGLARRLGRNAQRRCASRFLGSSQFLRYVDLFATLLDPDAPIPAGNGWPTPPGTPAPIL
jgi:trehalose synthase